MRTPETDTFGAVAHDYLERHVRTNNAAIDLRKRSATSNTTLLPTWRNRPIGSISRRDVIDLIDRIVCARAGVQANRTLARLRACSIGPSKRTGLRPRRSPA